MIELSGKTAVLTGAGSGIGRATALALVARGVEVVVSDLDPERCDEVAAEIVGRGGEGIAHPCDVTDDDALDALRDRAVAEFGGVDIVMNNVGILAFGRPENIPLDAWRRIIDANLLSMARSIDAFLPGLLEQGSGHIVNTASTAGLYGYSYERLPYSATKGAVVALTEALALYCRPRGVGVTLLCPGPVSTNIAEQMTVYGEIGPIQAPELAMLDPAVVGEQVVEAILTDTYFLPTHEEVRAILLERAQDLDGFVSRQAAKLG